MATLNSLIRSLQRTTSSIFKMEGSVERISRIPELQSKIQRWLEEQPEEDRESLTQLAVQTGWFFGPRMPVGIITWLGKASKEAPSEVDQIMSGLVQENLDHTEVHLSEAYPNRSHLLMEAFWAHRSGNYALSIPVLLAQADGIFYDRCEGKLFFEKKGKKTIRDFSSKVAGKFFQAHVHPLTVDTPLWMHSKGLNSTFSGLNRHQVLHGMKVDYNTELNSLKAIAFLDHLSWMLNRPADEINDGEEDPSNHPDTNSSR